MYAKNSFAALWPDSTARGFRSKQMDGFLRKFFDQPFVIVAQHLDGDALRQRADSRSKLGSTLVCKRWSDMIERVEKDESEGDRGDT